MELSDKQVLDRLKSMRATNTKSVKLNLDMTVAPDSDFENFECHTQLAGRKDSMHYHS